MTERLFAFRASHFSRALSSLIECRRGAVSQVRRAAARAAENPRHQPLSWASGV